MSYFKFFKKRTTKIQLPAFPERAQELLDTYGFEFSQIPKEEIIDLLNKEIENPHEESAEYVRILCGYLYCIGGEDVIQLLEKAKYGINMDVGCMIDSDWIDNLKNEGDRTREELVLEFIHYYK